uniref:Uncharacterized protein n=1 Tax=Zea mays TaxID=4577 RepID=A0A804RJ46_MAIZE
MIADTPAPWDSLARRWHPAGLPQRSGAVFCPWLNRRFLLAAQSRELVQFPLVVFRSVSRIRRGYRWLSYFNESWLTRITLMLVAFWWGIGEVLRLTFVNGEGRLISDRAWQENVCKFYIISNMGFAEPGLFLLLSFLSVALQKQELGT